MDMTPLVRKDSKIIQSYASGSFKISGEIYPHPVMVFPNRIEPFSDVQTVAELSSDSFASILSLLSDLDVVLLGTGQKAIMLPEFLRTFLLEKNIYPDVMDTGAACRTYNVLMAEGRRVCAILFPV